VTPDRILTAARWGTGAFAVSAIGATVAPDALVFVSVPVALALFALGCVAFVRALLLAADRSRRDHLDVVRLFLLTGGTAPKPVRRALVGALVVQVVVALVTASVRPYTPLAFGVLVPVFGLGCDGWWAAMAGRFPPRADSPPVATR
jgi:hypothetical protein